MIYCPRIVIIGAGFGGLWVAKTFDKKPVEVTLIDRNNFHNFLPLLYQVAAAELDAEQIVYPVRKIFQKQKKLRFMVAEVLRVDSMANVVFTSEGEIPYDFLIIAVGSASQYFGTKGAEEFAFPLKTLPQAIALRNQILSCFEKASMTTDEVERQKLLNFVVVGGGPTGVEFAASLAELIQGPLKKDFRGFNLKTPTIHLIEANSNILRGYPEDLQNYAAEQLTKKGIALLTGVAVQEVTEEGVRLSNGMYIKSRTVIWTAGVKGPSFLRNWGLKLSRSDRILVNRTLQTHDFPDVYAIGDVAQVEGEFIPQVAPAAIQMGIHTAKNILAQINGHKLTDFEYKDKGSMTILGRNKAIVRTKRLKMKGFPAWIAWLALHLIKLVGFRNRVMVLLNWAWSYLFFEKASRIILPYYDKRTLDEKPASVSVEIT